MTYNRLLFLSFILLFPTALQAQNTSFQDGLVGGSFTIIDERADEEISEVSHLYINGHLAKTFTLDLNHSSVQATITFPIGRENVSYSLCGTITITHNNHIETHVVSSDGILHHPDGRYYAAVGSDNFTDFFLVDQDEINSSDEHTKKHSSNCTISTS